MTTLAERLRELAKRLGDIGHGIAVASDLEALADEVEGKVLVKPIVQERRFTHHKFAVLPQFIMGSEAEDAAGAVIKLQEALDSHAG